MTTEQKTKIEEFIKNNNLTFVNGKRNTDSVILSGYALYLDIEDVHELANVIEMVLPEADDDYFDELDRVFTYAETNNYGNWWKLEIASKTYKF